MKFIYRLEESILGPISRLIDGAVITTVTRFAFLATLATFFWTSALTKLGEGFGGLFNPSIGAYAQILPKQMEAVGFDVTQLPGWSKIIVLLGTWGEFIIPALIVVGLFTRAAALAMIGFIIVMGIVDITGHGVDATTIGAWFDNVPNSKIMDQSLIWIVMMLILVVRGGGPLSIDGLLNRRSPHE